MRTLKKLALMSVLTVGVLAASASAASAVTATGGSGGVTLTTGGTQFNSFVDVSCANASASGSIAEGGTVSNVPITLTFANCTGPGGTATVTCGAGFTLTLTGASSPYTGSIGVPAYQASPLRGCRIDTATGCQIRVRASSGNTSIPITNAQDNGPGNRATLTTTATSLNFTTSGGFACLFVSSGSATFEAAGGGNINWTETAGSDVTLAP